MGLYLIIPALVTFKRTLLLLQHQWRVLMLLLVRSSPNIWWISRSLPRHQTCHQLPSSCDLLYQRRVLLRRLSQGLRRDVQLGHHLMLGHFLGLELGEENTASIVSSTNKVCCDGLSLAFDLGAVVITPRALLTTDGFTGSHAPRTISTPETSTNQPNGILQRGQRIPNLEPSQA
jgi:hypothetical protein